MRKTSLFAGKKIILLAANISNICLNESGELNCNGRALEFGKEYIFADDEHNDSRVRVYDENNKLLSEFEIKL